MTADRVSDSGWNPRYVAYARAHGRDPATMLAIDKRRLPGGCMVGFLVWMSTRWQEWRRERAVPSDAILWMTDYADFDKWLSAYANQAGEARRASKHESGRRPRFVGVVDPAPQTGDST